MNFHVRYLVESVQLSAVRSVWHLRGVGMVSSLYSSSSSQRGINLFNTSTKAVNQSFAILASGSRFTSASVDAASQAIAAELEQSTVRLSRASQNIGDATSMLNIADGAVSQIQDLGGRLQELAVQSANGLYSDEQRAVLQDEFNSITQEIQRITETTEFNGQQLLSGEGFSVQVGTDGSAQSALAVGGFSVTGDLATLTSVDISTQAGAQSAIQSIRDFSQSVSAQRSDVIGTTYSRLTSIDNGIQTQLQAERESLARVSDADIASESANLVQNTIRMQLGAALLGKDSSTQAGAILNLLA